MSHWEPSARREALEAERRRRRAQKRKRWAVWGLTLLVAAALLVGTGYYLTRRGTRGLQVHVAGEILPISDHMLVLVMGLDAAEPMHTDTIMLVSLNSVTGHVGVLSIPRDTRVQIPGRTGFHRINTAHAYGGPAKTVETVEALLGVEIDYWVRLDFEAFRKVVDTVGGVEIYIPTRMQYTDRAQNLYIDLEPGLQVLDGEKALQYVRFRADGLGDVVLADPVKGVYKGRVERQLEFVRALAKRVLQPSMIVKAPTLIPQLMEAVATNLPLDRVLRLVGTMGQIDLARMETLVLPGSAQTIAGASYWVPNQAAMREALNRVLWGRENMTSVAVYNGNGAAGIAGQVAQRLRTFDYYVPTVGNADRYDYPNTLVVALKGNDDAAQRIATLLGGRTAGREALPPTLRQSEADVVVIVGRDYQSL